LKINYNSVFLYPIATKIESYMRSNICSNSARQACVSYSNFKKCCKKKKKKEKKKNTKKIRLALKVHILETAWQIQLKFGIGGAPPRRNSHRKFCVFSSVQGVSSYRCVKRCFRYSCKIHTCLSRAPGFLGHTTTTLCLD